MSSSDQAEAVAKPPPTGSANAGGIVVIEVGEEKRKYHVHKALVFYHSKFFKGAFESSTKEAEEDLIHIGNVDASSDYYPIAIETPEPIVPIVEYAFANIPSDRVVLMLLVNDFCQHWKEKLDKNNETLKLFTAAVRLQDHEKAECDVTYDAGGEGEELLAVSGAGLVTIEIGETAYKYVIHKALLVFHSEYFRNALKDPWIEAKEDVIKLEDIDVQTLSVFVHWICTHNVPNVNSRDDWHTILQDETEIYVWTRLTPLVKAYVLGATDYLHQLSVER
ncbi:hypothetical protein E8E11_004478 [Didymella keratinophila]|nr:hypothetical protein E8E11_004478 [Didymella keratinophila]